MSPIAAKILFGLPAKELKNNCIEPTFLKNSLNKIQDRLNTLPTFNERAWFLEKFLFQKIQESSDAFMMSKLLKQIDILNRQENYSWQYTKVNLDHINFSKSHFHRLCNDWLGMSYYSHIQLQQFRNTAFSLNQSISLSNRTFDHNYYDQSHFIRKFKQFADMTPNAYIKASKLEDQETLVLPFLE